MKNSTFWLAIIATLLLGFVFSVLPANAQDLTQTVRGEVIDHNLRSPLPGAAVVITSASPVKGTSSDADGKFKITGVPVGRHNIRISLLGYEEITLHDIVVSSGKETVLTIQLEEKIIHGAEVEIVAETDKRKPINEMTTVSARTFSVEETQRYAAAVNDPARMALAFAGVQSVDDGNNILTVRGNSPNGMLWRMEGVDIPNPNHFSSVGSSGGGISILSAQLLANSDFMTSAFPAEYGNAVSGVFDLHLRKGNNEKREFTAQLGVLGTDIAAEGPFRKTGGQGGSYLVNYRYSTLGLLAKAGILDNNAVTTFQDLSWNISMPSKNAGQFGCFGFAGLSSEIIRPLKDSLAWKNDPWRQYSNKFYANTGAAGITHAILIGPKTYLRSAMALSYTLNGDQFRRLGKDYEIETLGDENYGQGKVQIRSTLHHKINAQHLLQAGIIFNEMQFNLREQQVDSIDGPLVTHLHHTGNTELYQGFVQWQYRIRENITLNSGVHAAMLALNNTAAVDPRVGLKWEFFPTHTFSFGYGLHSQVQPTGTYFAADPQTGEQHNLDLGFTRSHHLVAGYEKLLGEHARVKLEAYSQWLFNVPVAAESGNTFSMLNEIEGYVTFPLVSTGKGRNKGIELTAEKMFSHGWYALLSGSVYDSKYEATSKVWYNTRFNSSFSGSFTAGKEIVFHKNMHDRTLGMNVKLLYSGGLRETTIDQVRSAAEGTTVRSDANPYSERLPDYFRLDVRLSLKRNWKKFNSIVSFDLQNATNRSNVSGRYWEPVQGVVKTEMQAPLIPVLSWKAEF